MNTKLVQFRKSLGLTQEKMAQKLGLSTSFYMKIEGGVRNPSFNFIQKFKKVFDVNINNIFFDESLHKECDK
jgi:DNA-binding XRE family transcriptional regulator